MDNAQNGRPTVQPTVVISKPSHMHSNGTLQIEATTVVSNSDTNMIVCLDFIHAIARLRVSSRIDGKHACTTDTPPKEKEGRGDGKEGAQ